MKFLDFRKYFFSYLYILCGLSVLIFGYLENHYYVPVPYDGIVDEKGVDNPYGVGVIISIIASVVCYIAFFIEIITRPILKFIAKKCFPYIKISIEFSIPKKLNLILSTIFYILFAIATVPFVICAIITVRTF